ncbi:Uncharacterized protein PCOAH_00006430 [Plasmodium coatneyi]|uniref:Uncharacterized protein n=1 Tax=Plasmodium coatneyi TaxID=208452 RepID=A0A1B1DUD0_9APIC|nr:Uncharacterized protein PCOAH_00006430 [Plasmodium coatneyi]ANQ06388.1 Uncharacterized protein PCOAH_00006430 [Plasmodium coatneyi]
MKITTLWNIAMFAILLRNVVHIFLVKFARTQERGKFSASTLWTFFKNSEDVYKRKILAEQEEDTKNDFLMKFIIDNNVSISDGFLSLVDIKILEDIDEKEKKINESIPIKKDTKEEEEQKEKKRRRYRACCKLLGRQCNKHNKTKKNPLTKEQTEATIVEEDEEEVEETPKKKRKEGGQNTAASIYYKNKLRFSTWRRPSDLEENNSNLEDPVFVPKVPKRKYRNVFLTKYEKELAKQKHSKLQEIYSYKKSSSTDKEISKLQDPGVSNAPSDNEQLSKNKPTIEPNVESEKSKLNLQDDSTSSEVKSEGNTNEEYFLENIYKEYSDSSKSSDSSHDLWAETENEENTGSDTDTSCEPLERNELYNLKHH